MAGELVLLTGATGMVGFRNLVFALQKGYRVRCAVRNEAGFEKIKSRPSVAPYVDQLESVLVPDIAVEGAYDEAVQGGVTYVVHTASPLAMPHFTDYENELIVPSVKGTVGILESASKVPGIKRVVITASVASLIPANLLFSPDGTVHTEKSRAPTPTGPYSNVLEAYFAAKVLAFQATEAFINEKKPAFDVINIHPGYIVGRDETVTEAKDITKGTNGLAFGQLFGKPAPFPVASTVVHLDDVARLHVDSLDPAIAGNQSFLASCQGPEGPNWSDALDIVKRRYPKEVAEGVFKVDGGAVQTARVLVDSSYTEKTFGFTFKTYEEQIVSVAEHSLELLGRK
ncbi:hypothetical protein VTN77DRAFT_5154 [Rasamsonia byssochlamydoides]|uniref:uncharacterized protein n=1 Tax=Rasamsonia byssochlamydoides TaxID=89139 RepID=UPI0037445FFF